MNLRYSISDTELAKVKVRLAAGGTAVGWGASKSKRRIPFLLLLLVLAGAGAFALAHSAPEKTARLYKLLTADRAMVTAISYNAQNPSAVVLGRLVHEGDTVAGYYVVGIGPDKVELTKDGNNITAGVRAKFALLPGIAH